MEAIEEGPHRAGLGQGKAQPPFEAIVARQQRHIFGTISTGGLEQDDTLDVLAVGATATPLLEFEIGGDQIGDFEGTKSARGGQ